jgi:hypothetical protein
MLAAGAFAIVAAGAAQAGQDVANVQDSNAGEILKRSRQAVGAPDTIARLQSLLMTGTSQIQSGDELIACDVEIRILLPDQYVRIDTAPFGEKRAGFRGRTILSAIKELGRTTVPPDHLRDQILQSERVRMLQLLIGATTYVPPKNEATFTSVAGGVNSLQAQAGAELASRQRAWEAAGKSGQAPPPDGPQAFAAAYPDQYKVDVSIRNAVRFRVTFDRDTHLPARLTYVNANGDDVTMTFGERRVTGGLNLPYRVTTTTRGRVIDNLILNQVEVNPAFTKADFER